MINELNTVLHICRREGGLYATTDLGWLGIPSLSYDASTGVNQERTNNIRHYIGGVTNSALIAQSEVVSTVQKQ